EILTCRPQRGPEFPERITDIVPHAGHRPFARSQWLAQVNDGLPGNILFAFDTLEEADSATGHAFPFTTFGGEVVSAYLDPAFDAVIQVYNDDTDELLLEVDDTTGFEEIDFIAPDSADPVNYYFNVIGFEGDFGEYNFTMTASDFTLMELAYGDEVVGKFNEDGVMEYAFTGAAGNSLEITTTTSDDVDLVIEILDTDDNIVGSADVELSGGTETLTYTFETDGLYFIRISDFFLDGGTFTMTLN
ncbi:MAG: PPC domain-containing protein, partial [Anaerolineae bacterium]